MTAAWWLPLIAAAVRRSRKLLIWRNGSDDNSEIHGTSVARAAFNHHLGVGNWWRDRPTHEVDYTRPCKHIRDGETLRSRTISRLPVLLFRGALQSVNRQNRKHFPNTIRFYSGRLRALAQDALAEVTTPNEGGERSAPDCSPSAPTLPISLIRLGDMLAPSLPRAFGGTHAPVVPTALSLVVGGGGHAPHTPSDERLRLNADLRVGHYCNIQGRRAGAAQEIFGL